MTCPSSDELVRFADSLSACDEAEVVSGHMSECGSCREMVERWRAAEAALRGATETVPEGYFESLASRIETRLAPPAAVLSFRARRPAAVRWALAAAAAMLVAVLSPWLLRESEPVRLARTPAESPAVRGPARESIAPPEPDPVAAEAFDSQMPPGARSAGQAASAEPSAGLTGESAAGRSDLRARRGSRPSDASQEQSAETDRLLVAKAQTRGASSSDEERLPVEKLAAGAGVPSAAEGNAAPAAATGPAAPLLPSQAPTPPPMVAGEAVRGAKVAPRSPSAQLSVPPAAAPPPASAPLRLAPNDAAKEKKETSASRLARAEASRSARERARRLEARSRSAQDPAEADEAWAASVEAWFEAWQLGGAASDREVALAAARSYLRAWGARQRPRVRAVLGALGETE